MPHFFLTYTLPVKIRTYFFQNRGLIKYLEKSLADMLSYYLKKNCECADAVPGIIMVPQTFGERVNANLHFHLLCTTQCIDKNGGYWDTRLPNYFEMRMAWRNKVLALLLNMKVITRKQFIAYRQQYPKGFNFHVSEPEKENDTVPNDTATHEHIIGNIARYLVRTPLSETKITNYNQTENKVTIRYKKYKFDHKGKLTKTDTWGLETIDCLELLARLSIHVPRPYRHKVKYYGAYSTRFGGQFRANGCKPNMLAQNINRAAASQSWAKLIYKVYQDNPLICPDCGAKLKIKKLISPKDARRELRFLKYKTRYIGRNGFIYKEQFDYYIDTA